MLIIVDNVYICKRNNIVKFIRADCYPLLVDINICLSLIHIFSKKYDVTLNSVAEDWEMCRALVARSPVPDKQAVLGILDGKQSSDAKELALKKIPAAWEYMICLLYTSVRRTAAQGCSEQ